MQRTWTFTVAEMSEILANEIRQQEKDDTLNFTVLAEYRGRQLVGFVAKESLKNWLTN